jgi:two-component system NtrC family sensor kinase
MYSLLAVAVGLPPHLIFMQGFIALVLGGACLFGAHQLEMAERRDFAANEALRTAQAELVRAERMASVATLVRGIAHELNNPVGFIAGNVAPLRAYSDFLSQAAVTLADGKPRSADELRALTQFSPRKDLAYVAGDLSKMMDDIAEGARRSSLIISDLYKLTSTGQRGLEPVDLHKAVSQTVTLLSPRLPPNVRIVPDLDPAGPVVLVARAGQLEQVLVNLVDNAIRAVKERGTITVRVRRDGERIGVTVGDDGPGMSAEVKQRAFEPFFTTRAPGEGSGLGLAIAAEIVRGHRGTLELDSAPGKGTRVMIRLPATRDDQKSR